MSAPHGPGRPYRSKTLAAWLALLLGALGAHRFYLHGWRDRWGWLHPWPTLLGAAGAVRMRNLGVDDVAGSALVPLLGLMLSIGALSAIVIALTPDERWDPHHNPGHAPRQTRWGAVLAAVFGLLLGGTVLMGSIAFTIQRLFEWTG